MTSLEDKKVETLEDIQLAVEIASELNPRIRLMGPIELRVYLNDTFDCNLNHDVVIAYLISAHGRKLEHHGSNSKNDEDVENKIKLWR